MGVEINWVAMAEQTHGIRLSIYKNKRHYVRPSPQRYQYSRIVVMLRLVHIIIANKRDDEAYHIPDEAEHRDRSR